MHSLLNVSNLEVIKQNAMVMEPDRNMEDIYIVGVKGKLFSTTIPHTFFNQPKPMILVMLLQL
jgi:hypothetical protein